MDTMAGHAYCTVPKGFSVNTATPESSNTLKSVDASAEQVQLLVKRARGGDEDAFGELVTMFHSRVYGLVYGMVNNAEDAKELAQQTWVKAWNKLHQFQEGAGFFTWVYRIASNTCLDFLRWKTRRREDELPEQPEAVADPLVERAASEVPRPDRDLERGEIRELFEKSLRELTPEHRLVLTLREVDGLSYDEIAKVTGSRKGTVMSRLFYARRKMQESLGELK